MDDLLYTLFIVAWIAYGIYKGVKKNNTAKKSTPRPAFQTENTKQTESKSQSKIESILNEVFDVSESQNDKIEQSYFENEPKSEPDFEETARDFAQKEVLDSYSGSDRVRSAFDSNDKKQQSSAYNYKYVDNQTEEELLTEEDMEFDLREAIIQQAILERPY
jgi:hypothetical protein